FGERERQAEKRDQDKIKKPCQIPHHPLYFQCMFTPSFNNYMKGSFNHLTGRKHPFPYKKRNKRAPTVS
ncbi:hypothetical protein KJ652_03680, partial [Patescibacteria group bacterium]|nr:hypothetical protein [Patescibacteria group bacterium]